MNIIPRRHDPEGVPVPLFWRYQARHRARFILPDRPIAVGLVAFVATAGLGVLAGPKSVEAATNSNSASIAEDALTKRLSEPDGRVLFMSGRTLMFNGEICVHNPALVGRAGIWYWAELGRVSSADPATAMAVVLGEINPSGQNVVAARLHWSKEMGAFVTADGVMVGAGTSVGGDGKC